MNMFSYLAITAEDYGDSIIKTKGFLETLGFGGQMLLLGMGTVFAVLCLLWLSLYVFKLAFHKSDNTAEKKTEDSVSVTEELPPEAENDDEIIAVLAAAVAMAESENNGAKFRVVSFRRK